MALLALPWHYILWHYGSGLRDFLGIAVNFFWFIGNLFSVRTLLRTLVAPLKLIEERPANLIKEPDVFVQNLIVNTIMRAVGFAVRTVLIALALLGWTALLVLSAGLFGLWLSFPVLLPALFFFGLGLLL